MTPPSSSPKRPHRSTEPLLTIADTYPPELRDLVAKFRFVHSEGLIWLQDRRMAMLSSEMFALLRADLIDEFGIVPARGLLTRLGYATGYRDMENAWKLAGPHASVTQMMMIGQFMRALQGFGRVEPLSDFSEAPGFGLEWTWLMRNSLEAEVHSASFGIGSIPACWMEAGYSAGYFSAYTGKRILVQEVECRAMGAAQCRFVAKPVEHWAGARDDIAYFPFDAKATQRTRSAGTAHPGNAVPASSSMFGQAVGAATAFNVVLHKIKRVAPTNATVLLLGESGTGKSMFAREIHKASQRSAGPFVEVNCAAVPEALIESELFGVERGAFSGATASRPGRFEIASGGTIFLDEVATLSLTAQGKLLRVLQSGEMERLGSTTTKKADVRVIAATNEDLRKAIKAGAFRDDLFFRLNVFPIPVQPLRERRDDIPVLAETFRVKFCERHGRNVPGITSRAIQAMLAYKWPGNIRELENVIERSVILAQENEPIDIHHVFSVGDTFEGEDPLGLDSEGRLVSQPALQELIDSDEQDPAYSRVDLAAIMDRLVGEDNIGLSAVEDALTLAALRKSNGNVAAAARLLGVTRGQVDYRMKKLQEQ